MKIGVIIPIYNQERFLARALDSLLAQTDDDWVAYCVNDGSTDDTRSILARYAERDGRFVVIDKPNGGVSSARNRGMEAALSNSDVGYIAFLDPDDYHLPECIAAARTVLQNAAAGTVVEWNYSGCRAGEDEYGPMVWNKLFPAEVVRDVRFCEETSIAEDQAFLLEVDYRHAPHWHHLERELTCYCTNPGSNMHRALRCTDFVERNAVIERMLAVFGDDAAARDRFCRERLPGLLKQFYRHLARLSEEERDAGTLEFRRFLASLRRRGLLKPQRGSLKDLKYYLRFMYMSKGVK